MKLPFVLLIINFVLCNFGNSQAPSIDEMERFWEEGLHYEVTILSSSGTSYSSKIQLQKEGLLISRWDRKKSNWKIKFIKRKRLNKLLEFRGFEIERLFFHIKDEKIMDMSDIEAPDLIDTIGIVADSNKTYANYVNKSYREDRGYMSIQISDLVEDRCLYLKYGYYDERIDKLIDMVNELVPKKYRKEFQINKWVSISHGTFDEK
ncbi:MAG: hypothetical protein M9916_07400 [Crocinitomicaceae bacterium]|nr:hypothetical protein [Crocinitomicaceae bacterium]